MLGWFWRRRNHGETGAIAILTTILLVGGVLPLTALGASAYVRTSTAAQLQNAADAGALAGAAQIPLLNLSALSSLLTGYADSSDTVLQSSDPTPTIPAALNPPSGSDAAQSALANACMVALVDARTGHGLGATYAVPNGPLTCKAWYGGAGPIAALQSCLSGLTLVGPVLAALLGPLLQALGHLLPALFQPTIETSLSWSVRSPFDTLMPGGGPKVQQVTSAATEVVKNLVVLPAVGGVDPNQVTGWAVSEVSGLTNLLTLLPLGPLSGCVSVLTSSTTILQNLVATQATTNLSAVLGSLQTSGQSFNVLAEKTATLSLPLIPALKIPFLDFTRVCLPQESLSSVSDLTQQLASGVPCTLNATGAFRATLVTP